MKRWLILSFWLVIAISSSLTTVMAQAVAPLAGGLSFTLAPIKLLEDTKGPGLFTGLYSELSGQLSYAGNSLSLLAGYYNYDINNKPGMLSLGFNQGDLAGLYTNTMINNFAFSLGYHHILTDANSLNNGWANNGQVASLGLSFYQSYAWSLGLDASYSCYTSSSSYQNSALQFSPNASLYLFTDLGKGFVLGLNGSYIKLFQGVVTSQTNLFSVGGSVTYFEGATSFTLSGWFGDQFYAVKNNGFMVMDCDNLYKGGGGLACSLPFSQHVNLMLGLNGSAYYKAYDSSLYGAGSVDISIGIK